MTVDLGLRESVRASFRRLIERVNQADEDGYDVRNTDLLADSVDTVLNTYWSELPASPPEQVKKFAEALDRQIGKIDKKYPRK